MKVHVFESEPWITSAWQTRETNLDCIWVQGLLTADMAPRFKGAQIISSDVSVLDKATLQKFDRLKLIALRSTGTDQVDLGYCKANQIMVCHVPAYAQHAVAEHVFALLLTLRRHVVRATRQTRRFNFSWDGIQGFELFGKTIAVLGTGAIGKRVAEIAKGFGMRVMAFDKFPDDLWAQAHQIRYMTLGEVLQHADVVSLHVPSLPSTHHLLNADSIRRMPDGVVIINTARGDLVDSQALLNALNSGKVAAAGLDVLQNETDLIKLAESGQFDANNEVDSETGLSLGLLQHPNVLVTPHCAFFTREAAGRLIKTTISNIESFISGKTENVAPRSTR